jgi:hypothetical protein
VALDNLVNGLLLRGNGSEIPGIRLGKCSPHFSCRGERIVVLVVEAVFCSGDVLIVEAAFVAAMSSSSRGFAGGDTGATENRARSLADPPHQAAVDPRAFGSPTISFQPPSGCRRSTSMALERSSVFLPDASFVVTSKSV